MIQFVRAFQNNGEKLSYRIPLDGMLLIPNVINIKEQWHDFSRIPSIYTRSLNFSEIINTRPLVFIKSFSPLCVSTQTSHQTLETFHENANILCRRTIWNGKHAVLQYNLVSIFIRDKSSSN